MTLLAVFAVMLGGAGSVQAQEGEADFSSEQMDQGVDQRAKNLAIAYLDDVLLGKYPSYTGSDRDQWNLVFVNNVEAEEKFGALDNDQQLFDEFVRTLSTAFGRNDRSQGYSQIIALMSLLGDNVKEQARVFTTFSIPPYVDLLQRVREGQDIGKSRETITSQFLLSSLFVSEEFAVFVKTFAQNANLLIDGRGNEDQRDQILNQFVDSATAMNTYLLKQGFYVYVDAGFAPRTGLRLDMDTYRVQEQRTVPVDGETSRVYIVSEVVTARANSALGHRWGDSDYAIVFADSIQREVDEVTREMRNESSSAYQQQLWAVRDDQLAALKEFQELIPALQQKDFGGLSEQEIRKMITNVTAIHEARHVRDRGKGYDYAEEEIRAFEAELASGIAPYYSLAFLARSVFRDGLDDRKTRQAFTDVMRVARNGGVIDEDLGDLRLMDFKTLNNMLSLLMSESIVTRDQLADIGRVLLDVGRPGTGTKIDLAMPTRKTEEVLERQENNEILAIVDQSTKSSDEKWPGNSSRGLVVIAGVLIVFLASFVALKLRAARDVRKTAGSGRTAPHGQ